MKPSTLAALTALCGVIAAAPAFAQSSGTGGPEKPSPAQPQSAASSPPASRAGASGPAATAPQGSRDVTSRVQQKLEQEGLYQGKIDGIYGSETKRAVEKYQSAHNLRPTGELNIATLQSLGLLNSNNEQNAANNASRPNERGQNGAQGPATYRARNGAATRPGWQTSAGGAAGSQYSAAGPNYAAEQLVNGANSGSLTAPAQGAGGPPTGFFGYSTNMSNGFNAANGRVR